MGVRLEQYEQWFTSYVSKPEKNDKMRCVLIVQVRDWKTASRADSVTVASQTDRSCQ